MPSKIQSAAYRLLRRRLLSRHELAAKLTSRGFAAQDVERLLAQLQRLGYLNDMRLAGDRARIGVDRKLGREKVARKLQAAGIEDDIARRAIEQAYQFTDEAVVACDLLRARLAGYQRLSPSTAHRRAIHLLQRRGFHEQVARTAVDQVLGPVDID